MRLHRLVLLRLVLVLSLSGSFAHAQDTPETQSATSAADASATRAARIEAERKAKAASLPQTDPADAKSGFDFTRIFGALKIAEAGTHGLALHLGGLAIGSGLALGPEYILKKGDFYNPDLIWDSFAAASLQGYYKLNSSVELPRLLNDHAFVSVTGRRFDYPRLAYYGEGPDSRKSGHTDYRMSDNAAEFRAGVMPWNKKFRAGLIGGYQWIHIGSGTAPGIAQAAATYPETYASSGRGANYLSGGFFLQFDDRDAPRDPHEGTYLSAQFQNIGGSREAAGEQAGFNRYDLEAQHYFHYWNKRRVLALRVKAALTAPHAGSLVPFYLQPTLGGSDDLRGFRPYRFYDRNAAVATAEYRWRVVEALDMALFADAGKVYHNFDSFSIARVQTDIGFGIRASAGDSVPLRVDVGFSREGAQIWLIFYNVF